MDLPVEDELALVYQIRSAASARIERLQAIADAAVLATEQVQDKRIDLLEKGPEVEISDVVFDVLLGLALVGVGKALKPITDSIARELAGAATRYASLNRNKRFAKLLALTIKLENSEKFDRIFQSKKLGPNQVIKPLHIKKYNEAVRDLVAEGLGERLGKLTEKESLEKGLHSLSKPSESKRPEPSGGTYDLEHTDSPSVAMLAAAQSFVSAQRYAQQVIHFGFETFVRSGQANEDDIQTIREAVAVEPLEITLVEIRDRHRMLYEAAIWIRLFSFGDNIKSSPLGQLSFAGVQPPLKRYLKQRFARTIERWIAGIADQSVGEYAARTSQLDLRKYGNVVDRYPSGVDFEPAAFESLPNMEQDAALYRFFVTLTNDFDSVLKQQQTSGERGDYGFSVHVQPKVKQG